MSSLHTVRDLVVAPNAVRDFRRSFNGLAVDTVRDLWSEFKACGLDWWVHNRGANPLDVIIDGQGAIPIAVGAAHGEDNIKFSTINIDVGAGVEVFDLVLGGVLFV